jgi:hypothetical protein
MGGFLPPGMQGRVEMTPGQKGNSPGHYDPLPGDAPRLSSRRRPGRLKRAFGRLSRRGSKT